MPKRSIRSRFLAQRKLLSVNDSLVLSNEIQQRLIDSKYLNKAKRVALYCAINNEVRMDKVADYLLSEGKQLFYPRVNDDSLEFVEVVGRNELEPGYFGVLEPQGDKTVAVNQLDAVVVPGVVFDELGHRLGYGQGYYDRTLSACSRECKKVGVAYSFQLTKKLPTLKHDQALDVLFTEETTINFSSVTRKVQI